MLFGIKAMSEFPALAMPSLGAFPPRECHRLRA
jgi:hypothetical protein